MSIVVPAGNKKVEWSPKEEKIIKVASAGQEAVQEEEVNPIYEAAKRHLEARNRDGTGPEGKGPGTGRGLGPCCDKDAKAEDKEVEMEVEIEVEDDKAKKDDKGDKGDKIDKGTEKSVEEAVAEVVQKAEAAEAVAEKVGEAVAKIEDAAAEVKAALGNENTDAKVEGSPSIPGIPAALEKPEGELIVESKPEDAACSAIADVKKEVAMDKSASVEEEFCKFAKLSDKNRKKLVNYWRDMLQYPKDYVALLTKDYEK